MFDYSGHNRVYFVHLCCEEMKALKNMAIFYVVAHLCEKQSFLNEA